MTEVNRIERAAEDPDRARSRHASRRVRDGVSRSIPSEAGRCSSGSLAALARARAIPRQAASSSSSSPSPRTPEIWTSGSLRFAHVLSSVVRARRDRRAHRSCSRRRSAALRRPAGSKSRSSSLNRVEVLDRIASGCARDVDEVHEHLRALDVAQEPVAEAVALVRALDQSRARRRRRSCGRRSALTTPRFGHERRERVVRRSSVAPRRCARSAWTCRRWGIRPGRRRRSASAEPQQLLLARLAGLGAPRRAIGGARRTARCRVRRVRPARPARAGPLPRDRRAAVDRRRRSSRTRACRSARSISRSSRRLSGAVRALAVLAAAGFELGVKAEVDERVLGGDGDDVDGAAVCRRRRRRGRRAGRTSRGGSSGSRCRRRRR